MISLGELIVYGVEYHFSFSGNVIGVSVERIVCLKNNGIGTLIVFFYEIISVTLFQQTVWVCSFGYNNFIG